MDRLSWKRRLGASGSSGLIFRHVVVFLLLTRFDGGESQDSGQPQPIVATVGDNVTLPCFINTDKNPADQMVEWSRSELNPRFVHVRRSGKDHLVNQNPSYMGRTLMSEDNLRHGDISLQIFRVKLSDEGIYKCIIPATDTESKVHLSVDDLAMDSSSTSSAPVIIGLFVGIMTLLAVTFFVIRWRQEKIKSGWCIQDNESNTANISEQERLIGGGRDQKQQRTEGNNDLDETEQPGDTGSGSVMKTKKQEEDTENRSETKSENGRDSSSSAESEQDQDQPEQEREGNNTLTQLKETDPDLVHKHQGTTEGNAETDHKETEDKDKKSQTSNIKSQDSETNPSCPQTPGTNKDQKAEGSEDKSPESSNKEGDRTTEDITSPASTDEGGQADQQTSLCVKKPGPTDGRLDEPKAKDPKSEKDSNKMEENTKPPHPQTHETNEDQKAEGSGDKNPESSDKEGDGTTEDITSPASTDEGGQRDQQTSMCLQTSTTKDSKPPTPVPQEEQADKEENKMEKQETVQTTTDAGNVDPFMSEDTATTSDPQKEKENAKSNELRGENTNVAAIEGEKKPANKTGDENKTEDQSRIEQSVATAAEPEEGQVKDVVKPTDQEEKSEEEEPTSESS